MVQAPFQFTSEGWIDTTKVQWNIEITPSERHWKGMHPHIQKHYDNKLHGTITHYDAMNSGQLTVKAMTRSADGPSTHFVIDRDGSIYQLVSIRDRAWHAALKKGEWSNNGNQYSMPNGLYTSSPNQWFVGIDLSNLGPLTRKAIREESDDVSSFINQRYEAHNGKKIEPALVAFDEHNKPWEAYTIEALCAYKNLLLSLVMELGISKEMNVRHSDVSPTRKLDPGPVFPFHNLIDEIYSEITRDNWVTELDWTTFEKQDEDLL